MVNKYFDGVVDNKEINEEIDIDLKNCILDLRNKIDDNINRIRIADSLENIIDAYRRCNKYIDETTPWILAKDESKKDRLATVLYNLIESIRIITVFLQAYLPDTAENIFKQINTDKKDYESTLEFGKYESNTKVGEAQVLFKRIDKDSE